MQELRRSHTDDYTEIYVTPALFWAITRRVAAIPTDFPGPIGCPETPVISLNSRTKCVFITYHRRNSVCVASPRTCWTKDGLSLGSWVKDFPVHPSVQTGQSDVHPASYSVRTGM